MYAHFQNQQLKKQNKSDHLTSSTEIQPVLNAPGYSVNNLQYSKFQSGKESHPDKPETSSSIESFRAPFPGYNYSMVPAYSAASGVIDNKRAVDQNYFPLKQPIELSALEEVLPPEEEEIPKDSKNAVGPTTDFGIHHENDSTVLELPCNNVNCKQQNVYQKGVKTILRPGQRPQTSTNDFSSAGDLDSSKYMTVAPGGAPTANNNAAGNDCTPSTAKAVLNWGVVAADANNWRVDVNSLTLNGKINIKPWPSNPNTMVVPNTPNPVDGGNINNTAHSKNHWQAAIDDMADYNSPGGGAGPNWHSTAASNAHEWAHWNTDYVVDSVSSAAGGNWPQTNIDLDALIESKASSPTDAAAKIALQPKVDARFAKWRSDTIGRWNAIPDSPGVAGGSGYVAGMAVLNVHIAAVRTYAAGKGW